MNRKRGFTLIELLVVVLIISILGAIVAVRFMREPDKVKWTAAKTQIINFKTALKMYYLDHNVYPTQAQGLNALCEKPTSPPIPDRYPAEGYLDSRLLPQDPWKRDYVYLSPGSRGESYEIICYGKDGAAGGEEWDADISSAEL